MNRMNREDDVKRQPRWKESQAMACQGVVQKVKPFILFRRMTGTVPIADASWVLQEEVNPYGQETGVKKASNALN
jgi:hypothetical protein